MPIAMPDLKAARPPVLAVPGLVVTAAVAAAAIGLGWAQQRLAPGAPAIPPVVIALVAGALVSSRLGIVRRKLLAPGLDLVKKRVLRGAIVIYGLGITAAGIRETGIAVLLLVLLCIATSLAVAAVAGRAFGAAPRVRMLLGCGTAICGATAVVTVAPLLKADDDEVAFAVATIFLFNLVALVAFPPLGHALALTDTAFGAWVGTAVNDTSAVVATGAAYSAAAGTVATLVKVLRTLALVPMALAVAAYARAGADRSDVPEVKVASIFPWFVLGFAATAALAATVPLPAGFVKVAKALAHILIVGVLAAFGLHLDLKKVAGSGARSLGLGFAIAGVMAVVSLVAVRLLGIGAP
jgi:uncharacterized integral membrane protein (TIGR00698 family)